MPPKSFCFNGSEGFVRFCLLVAAHISTLISFLLPRNVMICGAWEVGKSIFCAAYPPYVIQLVMLTTLNGWMDTLL
jgi:hypothetical protein